MLSIIIPTFNEAAHIQSTIQRLLVNDRFNLVKEIIVVDGGSTDNTMALAINAGAKVATSSRKGRAAQMNHGASMAGQDVLYFLHADTIPPNSFVQDIQQAINNGFGAGCYMLSFDHNHWFLKANCWFTRFDVDAVRFGDQSLFVTRNMFKEVGGFCEKHIVLEDQHIIKRLKKVTRFILIKKPVITSARKYLENGVYKTQGIFFIIYLMYQLGFSQQKLLQTYRRLIRQDKL